MIKGFKEFIMRGNVIDLAVGVAIGAAFNAVVASFTASFLKPLIAAVFGGGSLGGTFTIRDQIFDWGGFITAIVTFVITAAVIYFLVVVPFNHLRERRDRGQEAEVELTNEEKMVLLLEQIASKN
ncbi:large conductance mechanosensitive channel protein MscL [soil metagenome]